MTCLFRHRGEAGSQRQAPATLPRDPVYEESSI